MTDWSERILKSSLETEEIGALTAFLLDEGVDVSQRAEALRALRQRGETATEVADFVRVFLKQAIDPGIRPREFDRPLIDVCGTGGDGRNLFNVSTAVMFVTAGAGACVVKHGNRSITSKCGGADVLEALGVSIHLDARRAATVLQEAGCVFLFAPDFHPAFRKIAPVRKFLAESGERSIFNILGPLLNPALPEFQLAGVFEGRLLDLYAESLGKLGRRRAWAVHGGHGEDEISIDAPTQVAVWEEGNITRLEIDPAKLDLPDSEPASLIGSDASTNAAIIQGILDGTIRDTRCDVVVLNSGAALVTCGIAATLDEGIGRATESLRSGAAGNALKVLRAAA